MNFNYKPIFLAMLLTGISSSVLAQEDGNAAHFFEYNNSCLAAKEGKKCVELNISNSIDKKGKEFDYQWDFGDGSTAWGLDVEHCYQNYNTYFVVLNLIDKKNKSVIRNELSIEVALTSPTIYSIDTVYKNTKVAFAYNNNKTLNYTVNSVLWKIKDQVFYGKKINHKFKNEGFYLVEMGIIGNMKDKKHIEGCGLTGVFVKTAN